MLFTYAYSGQKHSHCKKAGAMLVHIYIQYLSAEYAFLEVLIDRLVQLDSY